MWGWQVWRLSFILGLIPVVGMLCWRLFRLEESSVWADKQHRLQREVRVCYLRVCQLRGISLYFSFMGCAFLGFVFWGFLTMQDPIQRPLPDALSYSDAPFLHVLLGAVCSWSKGTFLTCTTETRRGDRV